MVFTMFKKKERKKSCSTRHNVCRWKQAQFLLRLKYLKHAASQLFALCGHTFITASTRVQSLLGR